MISNISKRYARAFFDIALEEKQVEKYYNELNQVVSVISQNKALRDFLANPVFEQESKKGVMESIIAKLKLSGITVNFLKLLVDKRRIEVLSDIVICYRQLMDETLKKVTEIYDQEVDNAIAAMMSMIEPLMIVVIGGIVGFIVIAMYLPIFSLAGTLG